MTPVEKNREQTILFHEQLPELLKLHHGKWVVFREGKVVEVCDDAKTAYHMSAELFDADGGSVVAQVIPQDVLPLTATMLFGLA